MAYPELGHERPHAALPTAAITLRHDIVQPVATIARGPADDIRRLIPARAGA